MAEDQKQSLSNSIPDSGLAPIHSISSSTREKILEHVFIGDCLRLLWQRGISDAEVLHADVDAGGYDLVMQVGPVMRHIQLKSSFNGSTVRSQAINARLETKPSGCVIWLGFDQETLVLGPSTGSEGRQVNRYSEFANSVRPGGPLRTPSRKNLFAQTASPCREASAPRSRHSTL